jgi:hypothetical protein
LEHVGEGLFFGDEGATTTVGPVPALVLGSGVHVVDVVIVVVGIAVAVHLSPLGSLCRAIYLARANVSNLKQQRKRKCKPKTKKRNSFLANKENRK